MYATNTSQSYHLLQCKLMLVRASGRFFYSPKADIFVVHNLYDGFDAYTMKTRTHFRSYRFQTSATDNVPLSCTLINDGRHVVCGTTSGKAVILDATTLAHQADLLHCGMRNLLLSPYMHSTRESESGLVQDIVSLLVDRWRTPSM